MEDPELDSSSEDDEATLTGEGTILGPTSLAHLVHSTAFMPPEAFVEHNRRARLSLQVSANGDGVIRFHSSASASKDDHDRSIDLNDLEQSLRASPTTITTPSMNLVRQRLSVDVMDKLHSDYFDHLATLFPIVTRSEFGGGASSEVRYAVASVAARSRTVPPIVRSSLHTELTRVLSATQLCRASSLSTITALLILSLHHDAHGPASTAESDLWNRTGIAIRMAQDLGLHRDLRRKEVDTYAIELRRRLWGSCVAADRWVSLYLGRPLTIDLTDCDVRLPSSSEWVKPGKSEEVLPSTILGTDADQPFGFNTEMVKLSILFGRVLKTIYSPTGLMNATDAQIEGLLSDIDSWHSSLPATLQYTGPDSPPDPGILQLGYACLLVLLFRVFMRISYVCPTHLKFSLTIERMTSLLDACKAACAWAAHHVYYCDTLSFVSYALVSCATLLFHAHVRRKDTVALDRLRQIEAVYRSYDQDSVHVSNEWAKLLPQHEDDPNTEATVHEAVNHIAASRAASWRSKCAGVLKILLDAAQGVFGSNSPGKNGDAPTSVLNPTVGVSNCKTVEMVSGLRFRPDPHRVGGGVFVAENGTSIAKDLPTGTVVKNDREKARRPTARHGSDPAGTTTSKRSAPSPLPSANKKRKPTDPTLDAVADNNTAMKRSPTSLFAGELQDDHPPPVEWPISSTSLMQVLSSGTTTDSTEYPTHHLPQAKLVTSIPFGSSTHNTLHAAESQADPTTTLVHDPHVPLLRISGDPLDPADQHGWAPNLNPNLNEGVWNASSSFLFEAPERIFDEVRSLADPTGSGHQSASGEPTTDPGTTNLDTHLAFDRGAFPDPALLGALPQSLEVLDFEAWSTWGARLTHGNPSSTRSDQAPTN